MTTLPLSPFTIFAFAFAFAFAFFLLIYPKEEYKLVLHRAAPAKKWPPA